MKWYRVPSKRVEICGSCNAGLRQNEAGTVQLAKTSSGLIRCRRCAETVQGWCLWPKGQRYEEAEIVAPASVLPVLGGSQPWARVGAHVAEFKRRQTGEREED